MERQSLNSFAFCEDGQGMLEYGLILGLVSVAAIAAIVLLGPKVQKLFTDSEAKLSGALESS